MTSTLQLQMHLMLQEKKGGERKRERKEYGALVMWFQEHKQTSLQTNAFSEMHCQVTQEHLFVVFAARDEKQR